MTLIYYDAQNGAAYHCYPLEDDHEVAGEDHEFTPVFMRKRGSGKSLAVTRKILVQDFLEGIPIVVFDPAADEIDPYTLG